MKLAKEEITIQHQMVMKMLLYLQKMSKNKLDIKNIIISILSSFIGIQSNENRLRDFESNKATYFIILGIIMTFLLITCLYLFVNFILLDSI